jgi:hypothetical protein
MESVYDSFVDFSTKRGFVLVRPDVLQPVVLLPTHEKFADATGVPDLPQDVDGLYLYKGGRAYNESWSLVHYLISDGSDAFILYPRALKEPNASGTPERRRKVFEDAFGEDLSKIEADWRAHVKRLGAPAAQERGAASSRRGRTPRPTLAAWEINRREWREGRDHWSGPVRSRGSEDPW